MESIRILKGASELIDIQKFVQEWDGTVIPGLHTYKSELRSSETYVLSQEMGVPEDTVQELKVVCGLVFIFYRLARVKSLFKNLQIHLRYFNTSNKMLKFISKC